jgi:hypothetical protein
MPPPGKELAMLIVADYRLPPQALQSLSDMGELILFNAQGIVYDSISGHPDIFLCQTPTGLIVAPNTPADVTAALKNHRIPFHTGTMAIGKNHPATAHYNAVVTSSAIIHHRHLTEETILSRHPKTPFYHIPQGYARCSLFPLNKASFITSDRGIEKQLKKTFPIHYFSPENIVLPHQSHGFIGGCAGRCGNTVFFTGRLDTLPGHEKLKKLLAANNLLFEELYNGPLVDGGGLFFLENKKQEAVLDD